MATSRLCSIPGCGKPAIARGWCSSHYYRWRAHRDPLGGRIAPGTMAGFLEALLSRRSYENECVLWPFALNDKGYGTATVNGKTVRVHRYICIRANGDPPTPKHEAAHFCGNRKCVNPAHIRWATHLENILDKHMHGTHPAGDRAGNRKLTSQDVAQIRLLFSEGNVTKRHLSRLFGVTPQNIGAIVMGQRWR